MAVASPFFRALPLAAHGLTWVQPPIPVVHPLDGGRAVVLERSLAATSLGLGGDGAAYWRLMAPIARHWEQLSTSVLGPLRPPRHPLALARFGVRAVLPARMLARATFKTDEARALLAGLAAHSCLPLEQPATAAIALVLGALGHVVGWPVPLGGAQRVSDALVAHLRELGGEVICGRRIDSLADLGDAQVVLCDVAPRSLIRLAGGRLPGRYRGRLERFRRGPGVFKVDWALDAPIPWEAAACMRSATVHVGGTDEEIAASEREPWRGEIAERPYVLVTQPSLFDASRAPLGKHTAWAYCHVPYGSCEDAAERIEAQIERFAPGFRQRILARHTMGPAALAAYNANLEGGDITGGAPDAWQLFARPRLLDPYTTPLRGVYLCSSSTPPGPGVHGMCGFHAAREALGRREVQEVQRLARSRPPLRC